MMAAYNRWANQLLYDAASMLSDEEFRRDTGAFFASMDGTLNHLLVADLIWMHRFTGKGELPGRLDLILHDAFDELREAREATDARIIDWVAGLAEPDLSGRFTYVTATDMKTISQRLAPALSHFFNHQTHHRGQAHMILSVLGETPPPLDLIAFQRSAEGRDYA
jgi:uncharacterized damage-inducible protein DinB